MKTSSVLLATMCLAILAPANLLGQAAILFMNSSTYPLRLTDGTISPEGIILTPGTITLTLGNASTATFGIGPASVRVELFAGVTLETLAHIPIGSNEDLPYVTNTANATLAAAQGTFPGGSPMYLPEQPGFDGSAPVLFQFRAWSIGGDNALTYADRLLSGTGFAGTSEVIAYIPAPGVEFPDPMFGPGPNQWQGLTLYTVVPEPATLALLGLVAALAVRRPMDRFLRVKRGSWTNS